MMIKNLQPRLVELGKIKIGGKGAERTSQSSGRKFRAPEKWDHIVITSLERDAKGDFKADAPLMARLIEATRSEDGKLREIPIALLSDEVEDALQSAHVLYVGRQRVAQCDGETCTWYSDPRTKQAFQQPRVGKCAGEHEREGWKPHATFSCQIAAGEARFGGVYKLRTTSIITIERLYSSLQTVKALTGGFLRGAPLRLVLSPVEVSPEGKSSTVYCLHVELRGQDLSEIQRQVISFAQVQRQTTKQLEDLRRMLRAPGSEDEPADEQADVAEEFAPGEVNALPVEDHVAERAREIAAETGGRVSAGGGMVIVDEDAELDAQRRKEEAEEAAFNAQSAKSLEHYAAGLKNKEDAEAIAARAADLKRSADQTLAKQKRAAAQTVSVPAPAASKANGSQPPPSAIDADSLPF